ncbi:coat protein [Turnip curly top virus]|uniref:Capsid protein n=1 Tax=Turnip curly top virus TaxID=859650 RepID=L0CRB4_9GEMI|nr:coat protein [Turnip curly top virus]ALR86748.1 coat protein [Turnip curly top virus]ALR86760.1 coat protein [Turnip curly top virus]
MSGTWSLKRSRWNSPGYDLAPKTPAKRPAVRRALFNNQAQYSRVAARRRWSKFPVRGNKPYRYRKLKASDYQIYKDKIGGDNGWTVTFSGDCTMLNNYVRGIGRDQRDSVMTKTAHMHFNGVLMANDAFWEAPNYMTMYSWIILDNDPGGTFPKPSDIFDMEYKEFPSMYEVAESVKSRFIVKRKTEHYLRSTGVAFGEKQNYKAPNVGPVKKPIRMKFRNIWQPSEWKDTAGGKYEDLKKGALLYVCICDNKATQFSFNLKGQWTMYFINRDLMY